MASIARRPDGRWRARYRDPDGRERARHFSRKVDAERWLDTIRGDLARGLYIDPAGGRTLFRDYAEQWRTSQVHRPSTIEHVERHLRLNVLPTFGHRPLGSIRPSEIQAWVRERSEGLAPATVEVAYRYLAAVFKAAVADRLIPSSPCVGVKLPRIDRRQMTPLTVEQVEALAAAMPDRYRATVLVAAMAGLRQGETLGLGVEHVDFLRMQLRVDRQLVTIAGREPYLGPPKTAASVRTVPLPSLAIDALAAHLATHGAGDRGLVFTDRNGRPIRRSRFGEAWRPAITRAGLPSGTRFHDLRHFYASLLIRHGESVKTVQARLGHASAVETLNTYAHVWPDSDDRTRQAVEDAFAARVHRANEAR